MNTIARELDYNTPVEVGTPVYDYPFEQVGDMVTFTVERTFKQYPDAFNRDKLSGKYKVGAVPDSEHADHLLIVTTKPQLTPTGLFVFQRIYSSVPIDHVRYSSIAYTKPEVPPADPVANPWAYLDYLVYQPEAESPRLRFYTNQAVLADSGFTAVVTGGTYTLTFDGDTTSAIAYNASAATVSSALNALTSITDFGGVTVTGAYQTGFIIIFNTVSAFGFNSSSLNTYADCYIGGYVTSVGVSTNGIPWYGTVQGISLTAFLNTKSNAAGNVSGLTYSGGGSAPSVVVTIPPDTSRNSKLTINNGVGNTITGGTFTLTLHGETTSAITFSSTPATLLTNIQNAVNALATTSAHGGITATVQYYANPLINGFYCDITFTYPEAALTGGTFTLTVLGDTTAAIAYNANQSTISAAVNALAEVTARGGATVILNNGGAVSATHITLSIRLNYPLITGDPTSLTPSPALTTIAQYSDIFTNGQQTVVLSTESTTRILTVQEHGFSEGDLLMFHRGADGYFFDAAWSILDENNIGVDMVAAPFNDATLFTEVGRFITNYEPGPTRLRARITESFYLPGVTPDIATPEDIPLPVADITPESFLLAVLQEDPWVTYNASDLDFWLGPIYKQVLKEMAASEA